MGCGSTRTYTEYVCEEAKKSWPIKDEQDIPSWVRKTVVLSKDWVRKEGHVQEDGHVQTVTQLYYIRVETEVDIWDLRRYRLRPESKETPGCAIDCVKFVS